MIYLFRVLNYIQILWELNLPLWNTFHLEWFVSILKNLKKTPILTLFLNSCTLHCSTIHQASYNARAVSVMLRASKLIIPSGHIDTSEVGSLKNQTQTASPTCCFKRSNTLWALPPLTFLLSFFIWEGSPVRLHIIILLCVRKNTNKIKGALLQTSVAINVISDFWPFYILPVNSMPF